MPKAESLLAVSLSLSNLLLVITALFIHPDCLIYTKAMDWKSPHSSTATSKHIPHIRDNISLNAISTWNNFQRLSPQINSEPKRSFFCGSHFTVQLPLPLLCAPIIAQLMDPQTWSDDSCTVRHSVSHTSCFLSNLNLIFLFHIVVCLYSNFALSSNLIIFHSSLPPCLYSQQKLATVWYHCLAKTTQLNFWGFDFIA